MEKIKLALRGFLLGLARRLGEQQPKGPVIRNTKQFFAAEIKVPIFISVFITLVIVYFMILMGLGLDYRTMISVFILVMATLFFFVIEVSKNKAIAKDNDAVVLICLLIIMGIFIIQISDEYMSVFIFPISAFVIMASMLLSQRIGLLYTVLLSLFVGLLIDMRFDIFLTMLGSGIVGLLVAPKIRSRSDFIVAGLKVIGINTIVITMFYLLRQYTFSEYENNLYYGLLNGGLSVIILLSLLPIFEKIFSRTTSIKLIELADFNSPLLKRLMLEAPGTYHHSLMTAAIAEQAADAIGTNSLLARVCAYYHDVGKIQNPEYFIENQHASQNPHDALTPTMSSLILASHVKDGVALAKKYNLDQEISNCIEQHHGTTTMSYFYHKALESNKEAILENFKYPGPKPQRKVAAIVMIADSVEAACRALGEPSAARIRETVENIINGKFTDGQFSDCPITLKDLKLIGESIISTMIGIYHARIDYDNKQEKTESDDLFSKTNIEFNNRK